MKYIYWGYNPLIPTFDPNFLSGTSKQKKVLGEGLKAKYPDRIKILGIRILFVSMDFSLIFQVLVKGGR